MAGVNAVKGTGRCGKKNGLNMAWWVFICTKAYKDVQNLHEVMEYA